MRYYIDNRNGCIAVRDRRLTNPEDQGLHADTAGVIKFWAGVLVTNEACPTCHQPTGTHWAIKKEDELEAQKVCDACNDIAMHQLRELRAYETHDEPPYKGLEVRTLDHHDGLILLAEGQTATGDCILLYWCDVSDIIHRWMYVRLSPQSKREFLAKRLPIRDAILDPEADNYVIFWDTKSSHVKKSDIPPEYLPKPGCLLDGIDDE